MPFLYLFLVLLSRRHNGACFIRGFSLLSACNARNTKPPAIELPPISYVQEMGGSSDRGIVKYPQFQRYCYGWWKRQED